MADRLRARVMAAWALGLLLLGSVAAPGGVAAAPEVSRAAPDVSRAAPDVGPAAPAALTFTVNTTNDAVANFSGDGSYAVCQTAPNNGVCSLRAAVMTANRHPGGATINLPAGLYSLQLLPVPPDGDASGDLNITSTVTILGAGAAGTIVDGGGTDGVFRVETGAALTMTGVTVRHGLAATGTGGGIAGYGQLVLSDSVVTGNTSSAFAGGVFVNGTSALTNVTIAGNTTGLYGGGLFVLGTSSLTHVTIVDNAAGPFGSGGGGLDAYGAANLTDVTIEGNTTGGDGGGILSYSALTLTDSTVDNNQAGMGGGLSANMDGSLTVFNSTISNNRAAFDGGGVDNNGSAKVFHTTIAGNLADWRAHGGFIGGGLNNAGTAQLWNTLFADNYVSNTLNDCAGNALTSEDYNYFETTAGCTINGVTTHNVSGGDPLLASLADNGGATQTRALLAGSPALDQIPPAVCRDPAGAAPVPDQRGVARPINGLCDIGAYEGAQPLIGFFRNLVRNGDAEAAAGSPSGAFVGVPDWTTTAGQLLTVVPYNAPGGFPSVPTDTVPAIHGDNFFAGGVSATALGQQIIDVAPLAGPIDEGGVTFDFSADLGGFADQDDNAKVEADFYDAGNALLAQSILGPVTAADRGDQTGLLPRADSESVPMHTRTIVLYITLTRVSGVGDYNDGYADNISLMLLPRAVLYLPGLTR